MLGAIIGDIVGSQYEWRNNKSKNFTFFTGACHYTDDSLMTLAIAQAFTLRKGHWREPGFQKFVVEKMVEMGKAHQACSWGKSFYNWFMYNPVPYNSYGNGSAMRVSSVGWISESEEDVKYFSKLVTEVSHNHPEGIKGAESVAMAIYLARTGATMEEIRTRMIEYYPEIATLKVDKIREYCNVDDGTFITCQRSVDIIGYSDKTIRWHINKGRIFTILQDRKFLVSKFSLIKFLASDKGFAMQPKSEWHEKAIKWFIEVMHK